MRTEWQLKAETVRARRNELLPILMPLLLLYCCYMKDRTLISGTVERALTDAGNSSTLVDQSSLCHHDQLSKLALGSASTNEFR